MTEILAIIPARGGSKGVPRKNLQLLAGKPLIAHTIEQAIKSSSVNRVVVSTDDKEIASVSSACGAEIIDRPRRISDDEATSEAALIHVLDHLERTEQYEPEIVVFLQCTAPLTLSEDIELTVESLIDQEADSAVAVTPSHHFLWQRTESGEATGINHDMKIRERRQERAPQYLETGAVYVMRVQGFKEARHRFFGKTVMHVMPAERCHDIDEPVDLQIAEVLIRLREEHQRLGLLPDQIAGLVLDFDGVFTDNNVIVFEDGREAVVCNRGDGWGLAALKKLGIAILVLSTEKNSVVKARCDKLAIACRHGIENKVAVLKEWAEAQNIALSKLIYVGNDLNDVGCLQEVGCGIAVNDAHHRAKTASRIVLHQSGGSGAVREVTDLIEKKLEEQGNDSSS